MQSTSDNRVESWLPKPTSNSVKYYEDLELTRNSMLKLAKMHGKKLLIEEEQELTRKLRLLEAVKKIFGKEGCFRMGQVCKSYRGPFIYLYYVSICRGRGVRNCQILLILRTKNMLTQKRRGFKIPKLCLRNECSLVARIPISKTDVFT